MKDKQEIKKEKITIIKDTNNKYIKTIKYELEIETINERIKYLTQYNDSLLRAIETNNKVYETNLEELVLLNKVLADEI
jgi:hypothetical protein